jgi:hypothetical protein
VGWFAEEVERGMKIAVCHLTFAEGGLQSQYIFDVSACVVTFSKSI